MATWNTFDRMRTVDLVVPKQIDPVIIIAADDKGASTLSEMSKEEALRLAFELLRAIQENDSDEELHSAGRDGISDEGV